MAIAKKPVSPNSKATDKAQIRQLIDEFNNALSAKDVNRMMTYYAPEVTVFDVKPPYQVKGAVNWRHTWEACISYFPDNFQVVMRDLVIHVSGDLALAHYLFRITGPDKNHDAMQTWIRATCAYKKQQGKWKIVHEHGSVPFNPHTMQAMFTLEP